MGTFLPHYAPGNLISSFIPQSEFFYHYVPGPLLSTVITSVSNTEKDATNSHLVNQITQELRKVLRP